MRPGILHPGRQRDCFSFDQLRARDIDVVVREVGPHICIKRDLPGRLLGGSQSGRRDATGGERQEGSAVEHDTPPWIDLPSILKQPGYPVVPTAAAILLAAQLFCQAAKMTVHAGAADCRNMMSPLVLVVLLVFELSVGFSQGRMLTFRFASKDGVIGRQLVD